MQTNNKMVINALYTNILHANTTNKLPDQTTPPSPLVHTQNQTRTVQAKHHHKKLSRNRSSE